MILAVCNFSVFFWVLTVMASLSSQERRLEPFDEVHVNVGEFFQGLHQNSNELPLNKWQNLKLFCSKGTPAYKGQFSSVPLVSVKHRF